MTLEQQVANLVTATTDLTTVVNAELNKVRVENANFKTTVVSKTGDSTVAGCVGFESIVVGSAAIKNNPVSSISFGGGNGSFLTAVGVDALKNNTTGIDNCAFGRGALYNNTSSSWNIAIGSNSMYFTTNYSSCIGLGCDADVTGNNQIQLGTSGSTVYAYGAVQNRSDLRDKTDIRPTVLGLSFIKSLRPVDFRWDLRDAYKSPAPRILDPNASEEEKATHDAERKKLLENNKISNLVHDGSKKGKRYHHGIIAQELQELIRTTGVDFGGFQDHKIAGGEDVLSVGYPEFIAPLIKAVQELSDMNDALKERVKALEAKIT